MNKQSNLVQIQTIEEYLNIKNSSNNYFNQFNFIELFNPIELYEKIKANEKEFNYKSIDFNKIGDNCYKFTTNNEYYYVSKIENDD